MKFDGSWIWILLAGAAVAAYEATKQTPTPLAVYPELGYTQQTSMAVQPGQKAPAAVVPISQWESVQQAEQTAVLNQCAGSYPGCSILSSDTQLGL